MCETLKHEIQMLKQKNELLNLKIEKLNHQNPPDLSKSLSAFKDDLDLLIEEMARRLKTEILQETRK